MLQSHRPKQLKNPSEQKVWKAADGGRSYHECTLPVRKRQLLVKNIKQKVKTRVSSKQNKAKEAEEEGEIYRQQISTDTLI